MERITDRERVLGSVTMKSVVRTFCPNIKISHQNRCPCPIHGGTHDNMKIYDDTNSFYCFACGAAGDPIRFVAELENITYRQAVAEVGAAFGIDVGAEPTAREVRKLKALKKKAAIIAEIDKKEAAVLQPLKERLSELMMDIIRIQGTLQDLVNSPKLWESYAELKSMLDETIYHYEYVEDKIAETKEHYNKIRRRIRGDDIGNNRPRQGKAGSVAKRK